MAWSNAVHGYWCNAKTYPTTCRWCGAEVFFFSCDCGCKVFFDSLGPPWPIHECSPEHRYAQAESILGKEGLARAMSRFMMTPLNWGSESGVEERYSQQVIQRKRQPAPPRPRLVRQDPAPGRTVAAVGRLREVAPRIDVHQVLAVPADSVIGFQLLGTLAQEDHARITLHTGDLSKEDGQSYTCLVPHRLLRTAGAAHGDQVFFSLHALDIPGVRCVWVCDAIEGL